MWVLQARNVGKDHSYAKHPKFLTALDVFVYVWETMHMYEHVCYLCVVVYMCVFTQTDLCTHMWKPEKNTKCSAL